MSEYDLGDGFLVEINRRWSIAASGKCEHRRLELTDEGDIVRCKDCTAQVSAYWALTTVLSRLNEWQGRLVAEAQRLDEARESRIHLIAAREVEKAWRSRDMVPTCPHCHVAILPTDGFGGSRVNREIEMQRRAAKKP